MQKNVFTQKSADQTHELRCYTFAPEGQPRAVLQLSHGMCEYIGRYEEFAAALCERGFFVCGNDHLGHGEAARERGELGFFAPKDGWKLLIEDLHRLTGAMKRAWPGLPYCLMGHSMGSFVARGYLSRYGEELDAAVLMGTSGGNPLAGVGISLADKIAKKEGEDYRSPLLERLCTGTNNLRFLKERDVHSWLTKDGSIRKKYAEDPLCSFRFTAAGYRDLFTVLQVVSSPSWAKTVPKDLPLLLVSGEEDPIGGNGKGVRRVYRQLLDAGVRDVSLRLYEADRHELINETDREQIFRDIGDFLEQKIMKKEKTAPPSSEQGSRAAESL